jgi:hypothetical protein
MSRSDVKIQDCKTKKLVSATLISGVTIREAQLAQTFWSRALDGYLEKLPREEWPEHGGWDWEAKHKKYGRLAAYRFYGIECDGDMQGLLLLSTLLRTSRIKSQKGKQITYGVYLASAPWNLRLLTDEPRYSLVGSVLVATAIQASRDEGCDGRIGLHALKQSEGFYKLCGMTDLGIDEEHEDRLRYFEMTRKAADKFLER